MSMKAFGFSVVICFGMVLMWCGIYLTASPIQTFEFILKEIIAGFILLAMGLFCIFFSFYSLNTRNTLEDKK